MRFPFALRSTVDDLQEQVEALSYENAKRGHALRRICRQRTDNPNATVRRILKIADDALTDEA